MDFRERTRRRKIIVYMYLVLSFFTVIWLELKPEVIQGREGPTLIEDFVKE